MPSLAQSRRNAAFVVLAALGAVGVLPACGGGMPLLHPAHTLRPGHVSGTVGASGNFLFGEADQAITDANAAGVGTSTDEASMRRAAAGIAASVMGAPGVAPFVSARVGVAPQTEAGLVYTGRNVRIDGRYAIESKKYAFSAGLGLHSLLTHPTTKPDQQPSATGTVSGVDASGILGYGVDLPLIVGYRSDGDIVQVWGGLRGGYEHTYGDVFYSDPNNAVVSAELKGDAYSAGGLVGLAVGLSPIWVAAEISATYLHISGKLAPESTPGGSADVDGLTVTPAGALIGRF